MFFSSVFVRRPCSPTSRTDTFASQRSEPSSMFTSDTPICLSVVRSSEQELARVRRRAQVRLGHDLDERRAAAVEVDDRRAGAVDAARLAQVDQLRGILLEVRAVDAHGRAVAGTASVPLDASGMSYWLIW